MADQTADIFSQVLNTFQETEYRNEIFKIIFSFHSRLCSVASSFRLRSPGTAGSEDSGKIRAVATIFPQYDFLRQIGGDHLELTMLLKPGAESHSFEPTPADMITVSQSDLFVYVGGDSDAWWKRSWNLWTSLKKRL